jgi:hypothetical protein
MSLERIALRLAATMALANGFAAPYPTIAQDRVYDSRQDPIEGLKADDLVPILVLYTDDCDGNSLSGNNGGPPFDNYCNLVMEISLAAAEQLEGTNDTLGLKLPQTEPELEAALDAFEHQVLRVFRDRRGAWCRHLDEAIVRIESWQSSRYIDRESNIRLAARQITAKVKLPIAEDPLIEPAPAEAEPYIPAPLGPLIEAVIAAGGPYAATAGAIQAMLTANAPDTPMVLAPFERMRLKEADKGGGAVTPGSAGSPAFARSDGVGQAEPAQD